MNDIRTPDAPGFAVGVDELAEVGYDFEQDKAAHLAKAMDRVLAAAGPGLRGWLDDAGTTALGFTWSLIPLMLLAGIALSIGGVR